MEYHIIYDFGREQIDKYAFVMPLVVLLFAVLSLWQGYTRKETKETAIGIILVLFACILGNFLIPLELSKYSTSKNIYTQQTYRIVEGIVENFTPDAPAIGRKYESFTVQDITFRYSDYDETYYGFNNMASHGGPMKAGLYVRLSYFWKEDRAIILKIELPKNPEKTGNSNPNKTPSIERDQEENSTDKDESYHRIKDGIPQNREGKTEDTNTEKNVRAKVRKNKNREQNSVSPDARSSYNSSEGYF